MGAQEYACIMNPKTSQIIHKLTNNKQTHVTKLSLSQDELLLAVGYFDGEILIYNIPENL